MHTLRIVHFLFDIIYSLLVVVFILGFIKSYEKKAKATESPNYGSSLLIKRISNLSSTYKPHSIAPRSTFRYLPNSDIKFVQSTKDIVPNFGSLSALNSSIFNGLPPKQSLKATNLAKESSTRQFSRDNFTIDKLETQKNMSLKNVERFRRNMAQINMRKKSSTKPKRKSATKKVQSLKTIRHSATSERNTCKCSTQRPENSAKRPRTTRPTLHSDRGDMRLQIPSSMRLPETRSTLLIPSGMSPTKIYKPINMKRPKLIPSNKLAKNNKKLTTRKVMRKVPVITRTSMMPRSKMIKADPESTTLTKQELLSFKQHTSTPTTELKNTLPWKEMIIELLREGVLKIADPNELNQTPKPKIEESGDAIIKVFQFENVESAVPSTTLIPETTTDIGDESDWGLDEFGNQKVPYFMTTESLKSDYQKIYEAVTQYRWAPYLKQNTFNPYYIPYFTQTFPDYQPTNKKIANQLTLHNFNQYTTDYPPQDTRKLKVYNAEDYYERHKLTR